MLLCYLQAEGARVALSCIADSGTPALPQQAKGFLLTLRRTTRHGAQTRQTFSQLIALWYICAFICNVCMWLRFDSQVGGLSASAIPCQNLYLRFFFVARHASHVMLI